MLKAYGLTVLLALIAGLSLIAHFSRGPIENHQAAMLVYGCMVSLTIFSVWWSVMPSRWAVEFFQRLAIALGAFVLGINSAYSQISFKDQWAQEMLSTSGAWYLWLGLEVALTIGLIIGLYRLDEGQKGSPESAKA